MSLVRRVETLLAPGGELARRWPRYEERTVQRRLAADIARVVERGGTLLAEAPTGVGKSLAYLLPAVLHAARRGTRRVVVATCTRSLQDQLFERDLPALLEALDLRLACARLKGKQNYLCPRALAAGRRATAPRRTRPSRSCAAGRPPTRRATSTASRPPTPRRCAACAAGSARTRTPAPCSPAARAASATGCGRGAWRRRRAMVVVNHALLALSGEVDGLLPDFDVLVVDEAHRLEGVLLGPARGRRCRATASRRCCGCSARGGGAARARRGDARDPAGLLARVRGFALPLFAARGRRRGERDELDALGKRVTQARAGRRPLLRRHRAAGRAPRGLRRARALPLGARAARARPRAARGGAVALQPLRALAPPAGGGPRGRSAAARRPTTWSGELEQVAGRFAQLGRRPRPPRRGHAAATGSTGAAPAAAGSSCTARR